MALRIQNNIAAMNTHRNLVFNDAALSKSLERLSSGFRINRASDDAAGLSISQSMRANIASMKVAQRNTSEATSLLQVAEGGMEQTGNMLTRLKELATQAASANVNSTDRTKINSEANALVNEIDRIANSTKYAGTTLLDGSYGVTISGQTTITATTGGLASATGMAADTDYTLVVTDGQGSNLKVTLTLSGSTANAQTVDNVEAPSGSNTTSVSFAAFGITLSFNSNMAAGSTTWSFYATDAGNSDFQVGNDNNSNNRVTISVGNATATASGGLGLSTDMLTSASAAQTALDTIDTAISTLSTRRGDIGASVNRLSYANANLASNVENTQAAESVIRDADMASEMTSFTKNQILLQAGTAMLAQANLAPQQVLSLFR